MLDHSTGDEAPGKSALRIALAGLLTTVVVLELLTGTLLGLYYCPAPDAALASTRFIHQSVPSGAVVRGMHVWGTTLLVLLTTAYLLVSFLAGSFAGSGRWSWMTGLLLALSIGIQAFFGSVLPWDARGQSAIGVAAGIAGSAPWIGDHLRALVLGQDHPGALTLTRCAILHLWIVPAMLLVILGAHVRQWRAPDGGRRPEPWWSSLITSIVVLSLVAAAAARPPEPPPLPEAGGALVSTRPEWYFLPLYQLLELAPGPWTFWIGAALPGALALVALSWPWLERRPGTVSERRGPIGLAALFGITVLALLGQALRTIEPAISPPGAVRPDSTAVPASQKDPARGRRLQEALRCGECHDGRAAISLDSQGSRAWEAWIATYLKRPYRIRYARENVWPVERMPDFGLTDQEAADLATALALATDARRFPDRDTEPVTDGLLREGEKGFREYQCLGCHRLGDTGARVGPDLTGVGSRLRRGYLATFLKDPPAVVPGSAMKDLKLWPEEAEAIAAYLSTRR